MVTYALMNGPRGSRTTATFQNVALATVPLQTINTYLKHTVIGGMLTPIQSSTVTACLAYFDDMEFDTLTGVINVKGGTIQVSIPTEMFDTSVTVMATFFGR